MELSDDRTTEQKRTHTCLVAMTDTFLSGWGKADGGVSYAAWAATYEDVDRVERWVRRRSDAKRVRIVGSDYRPRGHGHCHIYVVGPNHPALA